jgi:adenylate cyclase
MVRRDFRGAVEGLQKALDLNPSFALAYMLMGSAHAYNGMAEEGLRHLTQAARVSPRDFNEAAIHATVGLCHLMAGRYHEAVEFERQAVQLRPHFATAWRTLAAAAGLAGEPDVGKSAVAQSLELEPNLSLAWVEQYHPIVQQEHRARYIEGLRASGLR